MENGKKFHILTYGCQMNERDSQIMEALLINAGYIPEKDLEQADIVVFNTCSVRHSAENKVFGKVGSMVNLRKRKSNLIVAFGGCMAQVPVNVEKLKKMKVNIIFGTHNIETLPELLEEYQRDHKQIISVLEKNRADVVEFPNERELGVSTNVNVMYGCDNFCTYCIVPYTRGRERSRTPEDVVKEVRFLADRGFKEVVLLGQNVNSYGKNLEKKVDFADLLYQVNEIDGIQRIRFTTSHPKDLSMHLIEAVANCDKVCEHLHIAMQSGSNQILKRMNRRYTREYYLDMVANIRARLPQVALGTDIIVGFPGETDKDFEDTLDIVQKIRFDSAFTFVYSPRTGTRAALYIDQVPAEVKRERIMRLNDLQYSITAEINQQEVGKTHEILVDGPSKNNPEKMMGRTRTNRIVIFDGTPDLTGKMMKVKVTDCNTFSLFGTAVEE